MGKEIRYYQKEAIEAVDKYLEKGVVNQLLCMATGTGKTFTAVKAIKNKGRILWGTHTEELISQSATALLAELELMPYNELLHTIHTHGDVIELVRNYQRGGFFTDPRTSLIANEVGVIKEDVCIVDKPIVVASMQTLWRRLDRMSPDHFAVVVADECHLFLSRTFRQSMDYFKPKLRLGLSATPYRADGVPMSELFDEVVYDYPIDKGMADGFLCKIDAIQIKTTVDLDNVHTQAGEFNQQELTVTVNTLARNNQIANSYIQYASGRKAIVFCVDVQHAEDMRDAFIEKGIRADIIVGDKELTPDRKKVLNDFEDPNSDLMVLMNVGVLVAGYDYPNLGCTISAAPTKSKVKFLQGPVGRLTRLKDVNYVAKYGQIGLLLDVVDNTTKHKLINTKELDKDLPLEKKLFISEKNRQMSLDVKFKRESTMQVAVKLQDIKVDLFALPKVVINDSLRMKEPATEKMLNWIASFGYDIVNVFYSKADCSRIIASQPASDAQVWRLKKEGYDISSGVTITEAAKAFEEIKARKEAIEMKQKTAGFDLPFGL